jgi:pyruvate kinase
VSHSSLTKVICTVGVKSRTVPELVALLEAGMNVARFDFSWGSLAYHTKTLENLRAAMKQTKILCATMLDTRGPEIGVQLAPDDVSSFDPQAGLALHSRVSDWLRAPWRLSTTGGLTARVVHSRVSDWCQIGYVDRTGCHHIN